MKLMMTLLMKLMRTTKAIVQLKILTKIVKTSVRIALEEFISLSKC